MVLTVVVVFAGFIAVLLTIITILCGSICIMYKLWEMDAKRFVTRCVSTKKHLGQMIVRFSFLPTHILVAGLLNEAQNVRNELFRSH